MKIVRIGLHSLVLAIADLAGIGLGAVAAYGILGSADQVLLQLPLAVVLSVSSFCAWIVVIRVLGFSRLVPIASEDMNRCLAGSLLWAPIVFVPLHRATQGYLTDPGNLLALALYQLPVNALALLAASRVQAWSVGRSPATAPPGARTK